MLIDSLRHAFRSVRRSPVFSTTFIVILALAVGGTGALLSLVNAVVLRPLAVREPNQLVLVTPGRGEARFGFSGATLAELRRHQTPFEDICGVSRSGVTVDIPGVPANLTIEAVSDNCDALLGRQPFMGRLLDERDQWLDPGAPGVVVVSYKFWKTALDADPEVIGRVLATRRVPLTIVGVAQPGGAVDADVGADLTMTLGALASLGGRSTILVVDAIGRLRHGVTLDEADATIRALWPAVWSAVNPVAPGPPALASNPESLRIESIARGLSTLRYRYADPLVALLWLAALLLSLASVNLGGLLLARTLSREHELSVLRALGATSGRLLSQISFEAGFLSLGAALLSVPIAWGASQALMAAVWTSRNPQGMSVAPDAWVWGTIAAAACCAGVLAVVPAALFVLRRQSGVARRTTRTTTESRTRGRRGLIVVQVAVSLALVFCAGLFSRDLEALRQLDPGYDTSVVRWGRITLRYGQNSSVDPVPYFRPVLDELAALPHVQRVALSTPFPGTELRHVAGLPLFSRPDVDGGPKVGGQVNWVSPDFFATTGVAVHQGREFQWSDDAQQPNVAVINRAVADELFPDGDSIGRTIRIDDLALDFTIVGVVGDATPGDFRLTHLPRIYRALTQDVRLMVRPNVVYRVEGQVNLTPEVRRVFERHGRHQADAVQTIEAQTDIFLLRERVLSGVGKAFAAMSILIGGLGVYALMAYSASRRVREAGIRMALGASRLGVLRLLMFDGGRLVAGGLLLGIPLSIATGRATRDLLNTVPPADTGTLVQAALVLVLTGALACLAPALRVARTAVIEALRAE